MPTRPTPSNPRTLRCCRLDSVSWPVLPWMAYPSPANIGGDQETLAKQAFIRCYNCTDVELSGGGEIDGGGGWWWCARMSSAVPPQPAGGHAPKWCPAMIAAKKVPKLTLAAPHFMHFVESRRIKVSNLTLSNSPSWTVHFQYCDGVEFEHTTVFNPNNGTIEAPNADGIDVHSSTNVHVHDCIFDVGDDALCCKSGADFLGRQVGRKTANVLFERVEVRNGHGLTIGSEASGGMSNITYRDIFINGNGGPQAPGRRERPGAVGGIHFKTGRGRGGLWEDISYINIFGNFATGLVGFSENHGSGYNQKLGPTNLTGTPQIRNLLVKDVVLTDVMGPPVIFTLAEAPIHNLSFVNVTTSMHRGTAPAATRGGPVEDGCWGWQGTQIVNKLFATGSAVGVTPPLPRACAFEGPAH